MPKLLPATKDVGTPAAIGRGSGCVPRASVVKFHDEIAFNNGTIRVLVHRLIDQGEFRSVFLARDIKSCQLYALKKVVSTTASDNNEQQHEEQCRKEVAIHELFNQHENIMPLIGVKFVSQDENQSPCCYMLFPYIPRSLGDDITARRLVEDTLEKKRRPFSQHEALTLFAGVVNAVMAMHQAGFSHRDIRVENVLLQKKKGQQQKRGKGTNGTGVIPVLTDMGSVGPTCVSLPSWFEAWNEEENIKRNTTIAYRAPELFGELTYGPSAEPLHYDHGDIWSLGCLLFAMLYGLSPFEMQWGISFIQGEEAEGTVQFVPCSDEKILEHEGLPFPPCGSAADRRYGEDFKNLVSWMVKKVGRERPNACEILELVAFLLGKMNQTNCDSYNSPKA